MECVRCVPSLVTSSLRLFVCGVLLLLLQVVVVVDNKERERETKRRRDEVANHKGVVAWVSNGWVASSADLAAAGGDRNFLTRL